MKQLSLLITSLLLISFIGFGQSGQLVPDTLHATIDTVYAKGILYWDFSKGAVTKTDSGYAVTKTAPMVFVGTNNTSARTDQTTTMWQKIFIFPTRKEIEPKNIISFYAKPK